MILCYGFVNRSGSTTMRSYNIPLYQNLTGRYLFSIFDYVRYGSQQEAIGR